MLKQFFAKHLLTNRHLFGFTFPLYFGNIRIFLLNITYGWIVWFAYNPMFGMHTLYLYRCSRINLGIWIKNALFQFTQGQTHIDMPKVAKWVLASNNRMRFFFIQIQTLHNIFCCCCNDFFANNIEIESTVVRVQTRWKSQCLINALILCFWLI